ncbi:hypothetical protein L2E82_38721 [Cichorium intybus]|uniref:Uncharacterized protein n=1 Tax=Cichorium intybus TaxID=13427 RepID=A0ACB9AH03_CICIN|nr:hypothetical protein L2E82_38721 [Cichorium intybus]
MYLKTSIRFLYSCGSRSSSKSRETRKSERKEEIGNGVLEQNTHTHTSTLCVRDLQIEIGRNSGSSH